MNTFTSGPNYCNRKLYRASAESLAQNMVERNRREHLLQTCKPVTVRVTRIAERAMQQWMPNAEVIVSNASSNTSPKFIWTDSERLLLVNAIRMNIVIIQSGSQDQEKSNGWSRIQQYLQMRGFPQEVTIKRLQCYWNYLMRNYIKFQRNQTAHCTPINLAIHELFKERNRIIAAMQGNAKTSTRGPSSKHIDENINETHNIELSILNQRLKCLQKEELLLNLKIRNENLKFNRLSLK